MKTKPNSDTEIMKALSRGLTTSTDVAAAAGLSTSVTVALLDRLLAKGKVTRTRTAVGYTWAVKP